MSEYAIERLPPPERTFVLGGQTWHCRRGKIPMALLFNVADMLGQATGLNLADTTAAGPQVFALISGLRDFLVQMVTKSEREAFRRFLAESPDEDDESAQWDWRDLQAVITQLVSEITNAPFEPPSGSASSPPPNGASSPASSSSEASTSAPIRQMKL